MVLTDWSVPRPVMARVLAALEPFAESFALQHRHPDASTRELLEEARWLRSCSRLPLFVNGRLDVALLLDAHLHLPVDAPSVADVRPHLPEGRLVSVAVHSAAELHRAQGADLALVSPVFKPGSKANDTRPTLGFQGFTQLAAQLPCPALALGGISLETLASEPSGSWPGLATQGLFWGSNDVARDARALMRGLPPER